MQHSPASSNSSEDNRHTTQDPLADSQTQAPRIHDTPPQRTRDFTDLLHAASALLLLALILLIAANLNGMTKGVETDARNAGQTLNWLMDVPTTLVQQLTAVFIVVSVLIQILVNREWLHSVISILALLSGYAGCALLSAGLHATGNLDLISALVSNGTGASPASLLPDMYAGLGAFLTVAGPRRMHTTVKWGWNTLYVVATIMVIVSWHSLPGVLVSFALARFIGMLIRFASGSENKGVWGKHLAQALNDIGIHVTMLERRDHTDTEHTVLRTSAQDDLIENSRIYDAIDRDGSHYVVSVLDNQRRSAGYLNQLWQWIRLNGVVVRRDRSAQDAMHHHLSMILGLHNIDLQTPNVYGVTDSGESSILVFDAQTAPHPFDLSQLDDAQARALLAYVDTAHRRGYTHRRITPDCIVTISGSDPIVAGWQNGDCASSQANIALDKVQLLALLCAVIGIDRSVAAAREIWGDDTLIDIAPFVQKAAVPAATRALDGWDKHLLGMLRSTLKTLLPQDADEPMETVALSRFNLRSFIALTLTIVAIAVVFTQMRPDAMIRAVRNANPWWALLCMLFSFVAWLGTGLTLAAFMDHGRRRWFGIFCSQAASGFTAVSMPAGVGPAFVNLQFLRKSGYKNTAATAIMSAVVVSQALTTVVLLLGIGIFSGRNTLSGMVPTNTLIIAIAVAALVMSLAMLITPIRKKIITTYLPIIRSYARQLVEMLTRPKEFAIAIAGAVVLNVAIGLGFWAALLAFGYRTNPIETMFIFMLANTLGSAVPTPGGLGAVEAALTFAFSSVGVPAAVALSATLLYRVCFYWLRIPIGALAMHWLDRHNLI